MTALRLIECMVYRCYDADDRLLYVGQGPDVRARLRRHMLKPAPWADRLARVEVAWFANRVDALLEERRATHAEAPAYPSDVDSHSAHGLAVAVLAADLKRLRIGDAVEVAGRLLRRVGYMDGGETPSSAPQPYPWPITAEDWTPDYALSERRKRQAAEARGLANVAYLESVRTGGEVKRRRSA